MVLTFLKAHHFARKCRNLHGIGSISTNGCLEAHGFVDKVNLSWPNGPCTGANFSTVHFEPHLNGLKVI